jgi:CRP-like cAMP-binding protein
MNNIDALIDGYIASEQTFPDKATIIEEGSKGNWMYVVLEGSVKVQKKTPKGMVTLDTVKEGEIFGELAFLGGTDQTTRSASIVVASGEVRVGVLDTERVVKDYEMVSPRIKSLIRTLTVRLREANERVTTLITAD